MPAKIRKLDVTAAEIEAMMADPDPRVLCRTPSSAFCTLLLLAGDKGFHDVWINAVSLADGPSYEWWINHGGLKLPVDWIAPDCACCGGKALDSVPCQGSDSCSARICDSCKNTHQCDECGLYACGEHLGAEPYLDGDKLAMHHACAICQAEAARHPAGTEHEDARAIEEMI